MPPQPQQQEHEQEDDGGSMRRARRSGLKTFLFSATFTEDISSKCEFWLREGSVVRIDLDTGRVTDYIAAEGLLSGDDLLGAEVLNGIAYDPDAETFYLTGKWWPKMFEVRFVDQ